MYVCVDKEIILNHQMFYTIKSVLKSDNLFRGFDLDKNIKPIKIITNVQMDLLI